MQEQFFLIEDNVINWQNIQLVERLKTENEGITFIVHFLDERSVTYSPGSPEGKALLNHWLKYAPHVSADARRIRVD